MKQRFRRTTVILFGLISVLLGLGFARVGSGISIFWTIPIIIWLIFHGKDKNILVLFAAILLGFICGWWRGTVYMKKLAVYDQLFYKPVVINAVAETDGDFNQYKQYEFDVSSKDLPGKIKIKSLGVISVNRGDVLQISGRLYRTKGSRMASISYANIKVIKRNKTPIDSIRGKLITGMQNALPEPHASFGLGLMIGQRSSLPKDYSDALSIVGLTHIIAVSGYNLTIIIRFVRRAGRDKSKYQVTALNLSLILGFILITGFSASIVRAAIVSLLSIFAWYYGRTFRPLLLIVLVAAITAFWNPIYLWSDIGWWLSFLAFFGVMVLAPILVNKLSTKEPNIFLILIIETIAAQLMTMPLIMYIFQQVSPLALVSNVLVVPFVPAAMLFAFVAGISGMFVPSYAGWLAVPAKIIMTYIHDTVMFMTRMSFASYKTEISLAVMIMAYFVIGLICFLLFKTEVKRDMITKSLDDL